MPVSVHIPTRIRVDPGALFLRRGCLESALTDAATRALKNSREVVLAKRGGYVGVQCHPPEFTWSGDALPDVPASLRSIVEIHVGNAFDSALEKAGVHTTGLDSEQSSDPLRDSPVSPVDQDRLEPALAMYTLPSFDGAGKQKRVPVIVEERELTIVESNEIIFERMTGLEDVGDTLLALARVRVVSLPEDGLFGAVYEGAKGGWFVVVYSATGGNAGVLFNRPLTGLQAPEFDLRTGKPQLVKAKLPRDGFYHLKFLGSVASEERHKEILRDFYSADFRRIIIQEGRKGKKQGHEPLTEEQIQSRVEAWISDIFAAQTKGAKGYVLLTANEKRVLAQINFELPENLDISLINLLPRRHASLPRPQDKPGGAPGEAPALGKAGEAAKKGSAQGSPLGTKQAKGPQRGINVQGGTPDEKGPCFKFDVFNTDNDDVYCSSFRGEPSLDDLGEFGRNISEYIAEIAIKLQIPPCQYAGRFVVRAFEVINSKADEVGYELEVDETAGQMAATPEGQGNLKTVQFTPKHTPAIRKLRTLASITPLLSSLSRSISELYNEIAKGNRPNDCKSESGSWLLHFHMDRNKKLRFAIANLFMQACRSALLQLLYASRLSIKERRYVHLDNLTEAFQKILLRQLLMLSDLMTLRERLKKARVDVAFNAPYAGYYNAWKEASDGVSSAASGRPPSPEDDIVWKDFSIEGIRDKKGRVWTDESLERAIVLRRGLAEELDPVVKHMADLQGVVERLREHPENTKYELIKILDEMLESNQKIIEETKDSDTFAFRTGRISESNRSAGVTIPNTTYILQGIHRSAHDQIQDAFQGDWSYGEGINFLFGAEQGLQSLKSFVEFTGIVLLSVVCPPVGFAAGVGAGLYHYAEAKEKERFYDALMDPEEFISRAEIEAELFAAKLGLVLSFIPESVSIVRGGIKGVKVVAEEGAVGATRAAAKSLSTGAKSALTEMSKHLAEGVVEAFVKELVQADLMNRFFELLLNPLIEQVEREGLLTGPVGGLRGAASALRQLHPESTGGALGSGSPAGGAHE